MAAPVIQVRLVAPSHEVLTRASALLRQQVSGLQLQAPVAPGRRGDWLAYGTLVPGSEIGRASCRERV